MSRHEICGVARFAALLQPMPNGVRSGVGFPAGADLCVYIRDMARDCAHAQREVIRYLAIRVAGRDKPQHLRFAGRKPIRQIASSRSGSNRCDLAAQRLRAAHPPTHVLFSKRGEGCDSERLGLWQLLRNPPLQ